MTERSGAADTTRDEAGGASAKQLVPEWALVTVFVLLGLLKTYLDPFGVSGAGRGLAQDAVMRGYLSPNYGIGAEYEDFTHQVSVALIRESFLRRLAEAPERLRAEYEGLAKTTAGETEAEAKVAWPLPLDMHARMLDALLLEKPKAVFIDILFVDERPDDGVGSLHSLLLRNIKAGEQKQGSPAREAAVPIFFAHTTGLDVRSDLWNADCAGQDRDDCETDNEILRNYISNHLIPVPKNPEQGILRSYPVEFRVGSRYRPTPAFALLDRIDLPSAWEPEEKRWRGRSWPDLEIIWGTTPHPTNRKWMGKYVEGHLELCKPFDYGFLAWHRYALFQSEQRFVQTCPYVATIPAEALIDITRDEDIPPLIKDKVVFYGVDLVGATDVVYPPAHDRLAGVYMHAMALDNLLTLGPDYLRRSNFSEGIETIMLIAMGLYFVLFRRLDRSIDKRDRQRPSPVRAFLSRLASLALFILLGLALLAFAGYVLTAWLRIAPVDWIGSAALAVVLTEAWLEELVRAARRFANERTGKEALSASAGSGK